MKGDWLAGNSGSIGGWGRWKRPTRRDTGGRERSTRASARPGWCRVAGSTGSTCHHGSVGSPRHPVARSTTPVMAGHPGGERSMRRSIPGRTYAVRGARSTKPRTVRGRTCHHVPMPHAVQENVRRVIESIPAEKRGVCVGSAVGAGSPVVSPSAAPGSRRGPWSSGWPARPVSVNTPVRDSIARRPVPPLQFVQRTTGLLRVPP